MKHRDSLKIVNCVGRRKRSLFFGKLATKTCTIPCLNGCIFTGRHDRVSSAPLRSLGSHRPSKSGRPTSGSRSRNRCAVVSPTSQDHAEKLKRDDQLRQRHSLEGNLASNSPKDGKQFSLCAHTFVAAQSSDPKLLPI